MKEYKVNQEIYHRTAQFTDLLEDIPHRVEYMAHEEMTNCVLRYFTDRNAEIVFPAKSYAVSIIYSVLLGKYFGEELMTALSDGDLYMGTDKYYVPYGVDKESNTVYDAVLAQLNKLSLMDFESSTMPQVIATVNYFKLEFLLEEM